MLVLAASSVTTVSSLLAELLLISAVALICKFIRLPYTIALVAAGLLVGLTRPEFLMQVQLSPELLFTILLPILLFEAAIHLPWSTVKKQLKPILLMAVPGMLITAFVVGYGLHYALGLPLPASLVFGALISATDPISVLALFKELRAPKDLSIVIEGESLLNDGAAVVLFNVLVMAAAGQAVSLSRGVGLFFTESIGGLLIGAGLGWLVWRVNDHIDDHLIEITLSTLLAYGSYLIAQQLHTSGVMAVIAAGIVYGNLAMETTMSVNTRLTLGHTWEYLGFLGNSLVFLLIGTQVDLTHLVGQAGPICIAFLVVCLGRALAQVLLAPFSRLPLQWQPVIFWAGLRGSIAMALAMALTLPEREPILLLTFGVVLLSVFVQGLTIKPLLKALKIISKPEELVDYERKLGELLAQESALATLQARKARYHFNDDVFEEIARPLRASIEQLQSQLNANQSERIRKEQLQDAAHLIRGARRLALSEAYTQGLISEEVYLELRQKLSCHEGDENTLFQG
jgi:CPA1 family monovalent cation:H+ antiporter